MITNFKHMPFKSNLLKFLAVFIMLLGLSVQGRAVTETDVQGRTITVIVSDNLGPIPGANVLVKGTQIGGFADADGRITLTKVPANAVLEVSFVGYKTQTITVGSRAEIKVMLVEDNEAIDESIVVAYGHQKKVTMTGAVGTVKNEQLIETQVPNFANALAGRVTGLTTIQNSGQPGNDMVDIYIRGQGTSSNSKPLLLIDGVPSDETADNLGMLDVNEVASVTILKDAASTAVFGSRGANGVILITTRRGEAGRNILTAQATFSVASMHFPWTRVHSWEHAALRNQARINDGDEPEFSPYMIAKYREQAGDAFYPDRDMYKESFKTFAPTERISLNIEGGSKKTRYFANANIMDQTGNVKSLSREQLSYNAQFHMIRYTIRNNLDFNLSDDLKLAVTLSTYFQKMSEPAGGINIFGTAMNTPPTNPGPVTLPGYTDKNGNKVPAGEVVAISGTNSTSSWAQINRTGYTFDTEFNLYSQLAVEYDLHKILKGLTAKANVAYNDDDGAYLYGRQASYDAYSFNVATNPAEKSYYIGTRVNQNETLQMSRSPYGNQMLQLHFIMNYDQQFGKNTVGAMAFWQLETQIKPGDGGALDRDHLPYRYAGVSGRVTWNYDLRYLAEFDFGYNGSEQFSPENRFGFFPAASAGWVISNEEFLKNNEKINLLKLRASVGLVGNDRLGSRFLFYPQITNAGLGAIPSLNNGIGVYQMYVGNPNAQWEKVLKQNYAIEFDFLEDFHTQLDVFFEECKNRVYVPQSVPLIGGISSADLPKLNIGHTINRGFEFEFGWKHKFSDKFMLDVSGQYSHAKNTILYCDEAELDESYLYRKRTEGFVAGQCWGYEIDYTNGNGYINTPEELEWATGAYDIGTPRLGDFKYKDANGDGKINNRDLCPIGNSKLPVGVFGFNVEAKFRRVAISTQFNGMTKVSAYRQGLGVTEQGIVGSYTDYHLNAWTKERYENGEKISYPALSTISGPSYCQNSFFINNRSYLRLKNVQIAYSIPNDAPIIKSLGISGASLFIYGNNIFIIDAQRVKAVDAETDGTSVSYPLNRTYSIGLNVKF